MYFWTRGTYPSYDKLYNLIKFLVETYAVSGSEIKKNGEFHNKQVCIFKKTQRRNEKFTEMQTVALEILQHKIFFSEIESHQGRDKNNTFNCFSSKRENILSYSNSCVKPNLDGKI